jgi:hypothetical protein
MLPTLLLSLLLLVLWRQPPVLLPQLLYAACLRMLL